jgi:succinate dehydrogenase / fumarate reductase flavoprotein subunit
MMGTYVGIARSADDLKTALAKIDEIKARARGSASRAPPVQPRLDTAIDLQNLLTVSEAVTRAALERRESRGAHTAVEFPDSDKQFGTVDVVVRRDGERMTVVQEPIPPLPDELRRIVEGEV